MRCLHRKAFPCLPSFCLLAPLAFLPLCGKKHKNSRLFCSFLAFKSSFATSPKGFWASKVLLRLIRGVFGLQKYFRALLGVFLVFKSTFVAPLGVFSAFKRTFAAYSARFWRSKVFLLSFRSVFGLRKFFGAVFSGKSGVLGAVKVCVEMPPQTLTSSFLLRRNSFIYCDFSLRCKIAFLPVRKLKLSSLSKNKEALWLKL